MCRRVDCRGRRLGAVGTLMELFLLECECGYTHGGLTLFGPVAAGTHSLVIWCTGCQKTVTFNLTSSGMSSGRSS